MSRCFTSIEQIASPPGTSTHVSDCVAVSVTLRGPVALEQRSGRRHHASIVRLGDARLVVPGEQRTYIRHGAVEFAYVSFDARTGPLLIGAAWDRLSPLLCVQSPALGILARQLALVRRSSQRSALIEEAIACAMLTSAIHAGPVNPGGLSRPTHRLDGAPLRRVLELVHESLPQEPSLLDLADEAGVGVSRFRSMFRDAVGEPLHRHVIRLRVLRALRAAQAGTPLAHAAFLAGFADQSHLGRCARRFLGTSPGRLLKEQRYSARVAT
jgi:AraC-like DNA-binding protein